MKRIVFFLFVVIVRLVLNVSDHKHQNHNDERYSNANAEQNVATTRWNSDGIDTRFASINSCRQRRRRPSAWRRRCCRRTRRRCCCLRRRRGCSGARRRRCRRRRIGGDTSRSGANRASVAGCRLLSASRWRRLYRPRRCRRNCRHRRRARRRRRRGRKRDCAKQIGFHNNVDAVGITGLSTVADKRIAEICTRSPYGCRTVGVDGDVALSGANFAWWLIHRARHDRALQRAQRIDARR